MTTIAAVLASGSSPRSVVSNQRSASRRRASTPSSYPHHCIKDPGITGCWSTGRQPKSTSSGSDRNQPSKTSPSWRIPTHGWHRPSRPDRRRARNPPAARAWRMASTGCPLLCSYHSLARRWRTATRSCRSASACARRRRRRGGDSDTTDACRRAARRRGCPAPELPVCCAISWPRDRVAERAGQAIEHRGLEQECPDLFGLASEDLLDEIVDDVAVIARERPDEPGDIVPSPQRERRQLEPGDPAFGARLQGSDVVSRQGPAPWPR